ncbi:MAG: hypothetical protein MJ252_23755 [archaeon]|nr:hypothetical protein [archaeon]
MLFLRKIIFALFLFSLINCDSEKERLSKYSDLIKWGRTHGLETGPIHYNFSWAKDTFIADKRINAGDIIMKIPDEMLLTVNNSLKIIGKKLKKVWKNYSNETQENYSFMKYNLEMAFLCYLEQYAFLMKKGKFYDYFQPLIEDKNEYMYTFPILYTDEEFDIIQSSFLGQKTAQFKDAFIQECNGFNNNYNLNCNEDYYMMFRVDETHLRIFKGRLMIVPLSNKFQIHPRKYNVIDDYDEELKAFVVRANRTIEAGEEIILKSTYDTNTDNLLHFGKTFDGMDEAVSIRLPLMSTTLQQLTGYRKEYNFTEWELNRKDYMEPFIYYYLECTKRKFGKEDKFEAFRLFYYNLRIHYDGYGNIDMTQFYNKVLYHTNRENIRRIIHSEKTLMDKKLKEVNEKMQEAKKEKEALGLEAKVEAPGYGAKEEEDPKNPKFEYSFDTPDL